MRAMVKTAFGAGKMALINRDTPSVGPSDVLLQVNGGRGVDAVLETSGAAESLQQATEHCRHGDH